MDLIVAVYDDWGIGRNGTQPIALSADRKFFREQTKGATVIVGRRTVLDFPEQKPLPGRTNILLTGQNLNMPGFEICHSPREAVERSKNDPKVMVIGGGSIYRQMLPVCDRAYITKIHTTPISDTFFPNLDESDDWKLQQVLSSGVEENVAYEMCVYIRNAKKEL